MDGTLYERIIGKKKEALPKLSLAVQRDVNYRTWMTACSLISWKITLVISLDF